MIYLASPYSHPDPDVVDARYVKTLIVAAGLMRKRRWVFSPIVHCHQMMTLLSMPSDFEYWREYNYHMLIRADDLMVLTLPGWTNSRGVQAELDWWANNRTRPAEKISGEPWL